MGRRDDSVHAHTFPHIKVVIIVVVVVVAIVDELKCYLGFCKSVRKCYRQTDRQTAVFIELLRN